MIFTSCHKDTADFQKSETSPCLYVNKYKVLIKFTSSGIVKTPLQNFGTSGMSDRRYSAAAESGALSDNSSGIVPKFKKATFLTTPPV